MAAGLERHPADRATNHNGERGASHRAHFVVSEFQGVASLGLAKCGPAGRGKARHGIGALSVATRAARIAFHAGCKVGVK